LSGEQSLPNEKVWRRKLRFHLPGFELNTGHQKQQENAEKSGKHHDEKDGPVDLLYVMVA
jgi:hypothetical protein